jgi:hypothetical protein
MALGSTQRLREMTTRNLPGCKGRSVLPEFHYDATVYRDNVRYRITQNV